MYEQLDETQVAAIDAAAAAGFVGDNPQAIAGIIFALGDVLIDAGYTPDDVGIMCQQVGWQIREIGEHRIRQAVGEVH